MVDSSDLECRTSKRPSTFLVERFFVAVSILSRTSRADFFVLQVRMASIVEKKKALFLTLRAITRITTLLFLLLPKT